MNVEDFRSYCLAKPGVSEDMPFGEETLAFRVAGKIFALTNLTRDDFRVNLKCDPVWAQSLREQYPEITPGYHMNKRHWNTVLFETGLHAGFLQRMIDHSYDLVFQKLPKSIRVTLLN